MKDAELNMHDKVRELYGHEMTYDTFMLRHDWMVADFQCTLSYKVTRRKMLNPLTLRRYRDRTVKTIQKSQSIDKIQPLAYPAVKGYTLPKELYQEWIL